MCPGRFSTLWLTKHAGWWVAGLCVLLLSACTFQLRGSYQLPDQLQQMHLAAPERSQIATELQAELTRNDIALVGPAPGVTRLQLGEERVDRRVMSLLTTGQVAEYELIYTLPIQVQTPAGRVYEREIEVLRDYQDDPNFALAKTRELELLVNEMRTDAARRTMLVLSQIVTAE